MADSTPILEQVEAGQAAKEVTVNALFDAASPSTAYGRHAEACAGRTFGYYGTRYGGTLVANGSNLCDASDVTYMVVDRTTGAVSFDTDDTDWNDEAGFGRAYLLTVGASSITSYEDHRFGPLGIQAAVAGIGGIGDLLSTNNLSDVASAATSRTNLGVGIGDSPQFTAVNIGHASDTTLTRVSAGQIAVAGVNLATQPYVATQIAAIGLSGLRFRIELANTTASDPTSGLLKFNNATLASVTALYFDSETADGIDLSTFLASLGTSGMVMVVSAGDKGEWRIYKWTAAPTDNTGWWTFTVLDQAGLGTFEDDDEVLVHFLQLSAGSAPVTSVAGKTGAVTLVASDVTDFSEAVDDRVAALLVAGANITGTYNDGANTYTIAATASGGTELKGLTWTSDTASTADSDPGSGLFKWNNATQASATKLFIDNSTLDSVTITTYLATLSAGSQVYMQQADDATRWQLWSITTPVADSGYYDIAVSLLGKSSSDIQTGKAVYFSFDRSAGSSSAGLHSVPIMAGAMRPSVTGGCAVLSGIASAANQPDIVTLDFDASTEEYAQFTVPMPKSWNEGTITAKFIWSHAATTTNFGVVWGIQAVAVSDDDGIAVAFGTAQTVTDTGGTTNDVYMSAQTSAMTVSGSPAAEDLVCFRVYRKAADGSDTMTIDARLHGVVLYMTTDAETDA